MGRIGLNLWMAMKSLSVKDKFKSVPIFCILTHCEFSLKKYS